MRSESLSAVPPRTVASAHSAIRAPVLGDNRALCGPWKRGARTLPRRQRERRGETSAATGRFLEALSSWHIRERFLPRRVLRLGPTHGAVAELWAERGALRARDR